MPLILDLVRHGQAEPGELGADRARRLTSEGERALQSLAEQIAGAGSIPTRVFSSPIQRALDTARVLAARVTPGVEIEILEALMPDADPVGVLEALEDHKVSEGHVLLVGHLPQLEDLHFVLTDRSDPFPVATLRRVLFPERVEVGRGRPVLLLRP